MPFLIDSHSHLHFPAYGQAIDAVLLRMREAGVATITVGTTIATSASAIQFAEQHPDVWATVGYHPEHFTSAYPDEAEGDAGMYDLNALRELAMSSKKIVAIGETGLDFFRIDEGRDREEAMRVQEQGLRDQLRLAYELKLPLVIHCREALKRLAEIIQDEWSHDRRIEAVVHCFTGTWEEAKPLLDLGLFLSFTGVITFPPKKTQDPETHVHHVIERMPLDRILIETDAPWLTPVPHRGKQNEPAFVRFVAEQIAALRRTTLEQIARATTDNATQLFSL